MGICSCCRVVHKLDARMNWLAHEDESLREKISREPNPDHLRWKVISQEMPTSRKPSECRNRWLRIKKGGGKNMCLICKVPFRGHSRSAECLAQQGKSRGRGNQVLN